jgi:hypothetical protein
VVVDVLSSSLPASVSKCRGARILNGYPQDVGIPLEEASQSHLCDLGFPLGPPSWGRCDRPRDASGRPSRPEPSGVAIEWNGRGRTRGIGSAVLETNGTARKDSSRKKAPATAGDQFRHSVPRRRGAPLYEPSSNATTSCRPPWR